MPTTTSKYSDFDPDPHFSMTPTAHAAQAAQIAKAAEAYQYDNQIKTSLWNIICQAINNTKTFMRRITNAFVDVRVE